LCDPPIRQPRRESNAKGAMKGFTPTPSESRTADALQANQPFANRNNITLAKMVPPPLAHNQQRHEGQGERQKWLGGDQHPHQVPRKGAHESERSPGGNRLELVKEESGMSTKTLQATEYSGGQDEMDDGRSNNSEEPPHTGRTSLTPSTIHPNDVTAGTSRSSTVNGRRGGVSKQRHIIFHCATTPHSSPQGRGSEGLGHTIVPGHSVPTNGILLTVRYRNEEQLLKRKVKLPPGGEDDDPRCSPVPPMQKAPTSVPHGVRARPSHLALKLPDPEACCHVSRAHL